MKTASIGVLLILFSCAACFAQTPFQGLTPGKSTRPEVERVFGRPVNAVSETLIEYAPQPLTKKVYVQYRKGSSIVERIEVLCHLEKSDCSDFVESLHSPMTDNDWVATLRDDQTGKRVDYYKVPYYVVLTWLYADWQRTAFYSAELYEAAVASPQVHRRDTRNERGPETRPTDSSSQTEPGSLTLTTRDLPDYMRGPGGSSTTATGRGVSVSGRWSGSWTNSKGESGKSSINLREQDDGTIVGDEDGFVIENGRRSGNNLTWEYRNQNNGCRDYKISWNISSDGSTASGTYTVTDRCEKQTYTGKYVKYGK